MTWKTLPRSFELNRGHYTARVFEIGGEGWRFNILDTRDGVYVSTTSHINSPFTAMERAERVLANYAD